VTQRFNALAAAVGLPKIRLHDTRHSHATLDLAAGIPTKVMSERLGHSRTANTEDLSSHVTQAMQETAAANSESSCAAP